MFDSRMDSWVNGAWAWWLLIDVAMGERGIVIADKSCAPGLSLKEHHTQRIDIGTPIDGSALTLFGRHIFWCADASAWSGEMRLCAGHNFGDTKVREDWT